MKTVQYDLRIIHRKKVAIGAINRKEIDRILQDMITSGEALKHGRRRSGRHCG